jgi:hypothetical protein
MSNGLGAGFFAISLLAVLAGLAILAILATIAATVLHRRTGRVPTLLRYLLGAICLCVLGVAGFGILLLSDEAPAVAGLFVTIVVIPFLLGGVYFERTTEGTRLAVISTTVMAWGLPFFLGVAVAFGVLNGISSVLDLAPAESRQLGIAWITGAAGGTAILLGMIPIGTRLGGMVRSATGTRDRQP